jgi:hypothetical protein
VRRGNSIAERASDKTQQLRNFIHHLYEAQQWQSPLVLRSFTVYDVHHRCRERLRTPKVWHCSSGHMTLRVHIQPCKSELCSR